MSLLQYSLVSLVVFLGLAAGLVIALSAKEELKPGRRYFIVLRHVLLFLIIVFLLYSYLDLRLAILAAFLYLVLFGLLYKIRIKEYLIYSLLGIVFYLSSRNTNLFIVESALMFVYGLPAGSLLADVKDKKKSVFKVLCNLSFIAVALLLFVIF